jgi:predicted tellurium resistance membrane protein TerC
MEIFLHGETWIALLTLTLLEIILGVDNIIFISIVSNKLPKASQGRARTIGLLLALGIRIALLFVISVIIKQFTNPLFELFDHTVSISDLIFLAGGLFLVAKSTTEMHHKMEGPGAEQKKANAASMRSVIMQIVLMDIIFSFDSILTAVGLSNQLLVMIIAVIISLIVMIAFSGAISAFISKHPSLEMLALSFLILIGFMLVLEGLHVHVEKKYIYFALFFSMGVELLNMRLRKKSRPVHLHRITEEDGKKKQGS